MALAPFKPAQRKIWKVKQACPRCGTRKLWRVQAYPGNRWAMWCDNEACSYVDLVEAGEQAKDVVHRAVMARALL